MINRIPKRFQGFTLKTFKGDVWKKALLFLEAGKSLFLSGICGSGKTHLAVALLYEWELWTSNKRKAAEKNRETWKEPRGIFLTSGEFFLELKESFERNGERSVVDEYSRADLLVLDDMGSEKVSEWSRQMTYLLLDRRYREMKQTIITSNLDLQGISQQIDDRVASRIADGEIVVMPKKDWRVQK